ALLGEEGFRRRARQRVGVLEALGVELALQLPGDAPAIAGTAARATRAGVPQPGLDNEIVVFETVHHPDDAFPLVRAPRRELPVSQRQHYKRIGGGEGRKSEVAAAQIRMPQPARPPAQNL